MEDQCTGDTGIINWLTKLTRKITSGKIVPMHYGEQLPPPMAERIKDARALWMIVLNGSSFEIDAIFGKPKAKMLSLTRPAHSKQRILFPCPLHTGLDGDARADIVRRTKLAQRRDVEVKWVDHEMPESMIIINPPTHDIGDFDDGLALIDLSLPHLDTAARAKFEITQKDQNGIFSDLVKSFSMTWGKAHEPSYAKEPAARPAPILKGIVVA